MNLKTMQKTFATITLVMLVALIPFVNADIADAVLHEHFEVEAEFSESVVSSNHILAQTFTPATTHSIKYVELALGNGGHQLEGVATVKITPVNDGRPVNYTLTYGYVILAEVTSPSWSWMMVTFNQEQPLDAGTQYAITMQTTELNVSWAFNPLGGYENGSRVYSLDDGATWVTSPCDFLFREYAASPSSSPTPDAPQEADDTPQMPVLELPPQAYIMIIIVIVIVMVIAMSVISKKREGNPY